jgi:transcriptional regulator with GAF, ATPase, and Fis domain
MNKERLRCVISGLSRYELTGLEKQFVQSVEQYFKQENLLTDQQESILEGIYREKTRWLKKAILSQLTKNFVRPRGCTMKARKKSFFDSFREVVKTINSTLDLREVLKMLVGEVRKVLDLKGCAIHLLDPNRRTLEIVSSQGLSEKYIRKGPVDVDRSIAEAMQGKTIHIHNAGEDPRVQYQKEAIEEGIYGIVSIPLPIKGRMIGALRLYTAEPRTLSDDEINFAEALAEMGAIAIENARMYETIRKNYEDVMSDILTFVGYRRSI